MPRILITGGAGFIGSNLIRELNSAKNYEIIVIDNESSGNPSQLPLECIKYIKADIRDQSVLSSALLGVDVVVHLAADTGVIDSIADPVKNFDINVAGTFNLLRLSYQAGVTTFINASTGGAILGETISPIHEEIAPKPISPYGASKLAVEGYCSAFAEIYNMYITSLRFSNIYGPGSYHKKSIIAHFFKQILDNKELVIYGDGSQVRDFLFVGDLVKGIHTAIKNPVSGTFQLGGGQPTSINQLVEEIRKILSSDMIIKTRYEPKRQGEVHTIWCNIDKAKTMLNFNPTTKLSQGLLKCWQWFCSTAQSTSVKLT